MDFASFVFPQTRVTVVAPLHGRQSPVVAYATDLDAALSFCSR